MHWMWIRARQSCSFNDAAAPIKITIAMIKWKAIFKCAYIKWTCVCFILDSIHWKIRVRKRIFVGSESFQNDSFICFVCKSFAMKRCLCYIYFFQYHRIIYTSRLSKWNRNKKKTDENQLTLIELTINTHAHVIQMK